VTPDALYNFALQSNPPPVGNSRTNLPFLIPAIKKQDVNVLAAGSEPPKSPSALNW
jgi:hypothetical protein